MEPMALGSPGGSPAAGPFLPAFLTGEANMSQIARNNTLSPTRGTSPGFSSTMASPDTNRSLTGQRTLFPYQKTSQSHYQESPMPNRNVSISGPPVQDLFESLQAESNPAQTPTRQYPFNQSMQQYNQTYNDSYLGQASFNASRIASPLSHLNSNDIRNQYNANNVLYTQQPKFTELWITVFGFPQSASSLILSHFSQCGTIIDKCYAPQNGNWLHLKYSSRLECDRALNYNEKILADNIMIGVTNCKDTTIIEKENQVTSPQMSRVRPLNHVPFRNPQSPAGVEPIIGTPQKSTGLVSKALDYLLNW